MSEGSDGGGYPLIRKIFHWLTALLVVALLGSGLTMTRLGWEPEVKDLTDQMHFWHKWTGFTLLLLVGLRVLARWIWSAPPIPAHVSAAERSAARLTHASLYGLLIVTPLLGWAAVSAGGLLPEPPLFGRLEMPALLPRLTDATRDVIFDLHMVAALALAALAAIHILAAASHLIRADGVFRRMWF